MKSQTLLQNAEGTFRPPLRLPVGALRRDDESVEWRVWSPFTDEVRLVLIEEESPKPYAMHKEGEYHHLRLENIEEGQKYWIRLPEGDFPDPASRWQPDGVHGPSAVFSPHRFAWTDQDWKGTSRGDLILYELHVGTFTKEGTFDASIGRLKDLKQLGITAIELMPVGQFPGARNWGYDGVFPYAVQNSYGGPEGLERLVDAAHKVGIAVILDVVYNHLGPEGNYLTKFGPYFTTAYHTPWGEAINFDQADSEAVRDFMIENARMWVRDFHLDGLRLDAVHAIYDLGTKHLLAEISEVVKKVGKEQERIVHLIAESDQNDPKLIDPIERGGYGLDAVWADEFHHSLRALIAGDREGYFQGFGEPEHLAKAIEKVFVYDGCYCPFRRRRHGASIGERDRTRFVHCIHNHDQIGNRAKGDRSASYLSQPKQRLAAGLLMLSPCLPMLFMGEEYAEERPFPFFCSFEDPALIEAVRSGRREEFECLGFVWGEDIPDPQDEETFQKAILSWNWPEDSFSGQLRKLYGDLIHARKTWPPLRDRRHTRAFVRALSETSNGEDSALLLVERGSNPSLLAYANLNDAPEGLPPINTDERPLIFSTEDARYGGARENAEIARQILPYELMVFGQREWLS